MLTLQSLRIARSTRLPLPIHNLNRTLVTSPETPPAQKQVASNTALLAAATAAAGAAAAYWYLNQPENIEELKASAKKEEDDIARKARELADASKARAEGLLKQSQQQYSDIKASGQDKLAAARARADGAASDAQAKYDAYRSSARESVADARSSYADGRDAGLARANETKGTWISWLGWGRSRADQGRRDGAKKVAGAADDVRKSADKHT